MREELIVSGRMNPEIDPILEIWGWEIPFYLFVGGLAAGILFFAALYTLLGKDKEYRTATRISPFLVPFLIIIGLGALMMDLKHLPYAWQLYTTIKLQSPMSWGAWTLMIITPLSIAWAAIHIRELFPNWDWKYPWLKALEAFLNENKKIFAWILVVLSLILGVYTGILFSAFNARPLWNTSILGPLFLTSGLSAGAAVTIILSKNPVERKLFARIDIIVIAIELFLIIHMFMGFMASTAVQIEAANLFLGGEYTAVFWIFVVFLGMLVPAFLEILELRGYHIPTLIPVILVLLGSLMLRFIITFAGQETRYLY
jgi:formate-dependent nitrite reductase membrane component NrfD